MFISLSRYEDLFEIVLANGASLMFVASNRKVMQAGGMFHYAAAKFGIDLASIKSGAMLSR